jgi:uncharacterized membrane-anchored protein YhcB (DUF1043 family)
MSDFQSRTKISFNEVESDPEYQKATYEEQQSIKNRWFEYFYGNDQDFAAATPETQQEVYKHFATLPSKLDTSDPEYATNQQMLDKIANRDTSAASAAIMTKNIYSNLGFFGGIFKTVGSVFGVKPGDADYLFDETENPVTQANRDKIYKSASAIADDPTLEIVSSLSGMGVNLAGNILGGTGAVKLLGTAIGGLAGAEFALPAAQKLQTLSELLMPATRTTTIGTIASMSTKTQAAAGVTKLFLTGAVEGTEAIVQSALWTLTDRNAPDQQLKVFGTPRAAENAQWLAEQFGTNVLWDLGIRAGIGTVGAAALGFSRVMKSEIGKSFVNKMEPVANLAKGAKQEIDRIFSTPNLTGSEIMNTLPEGAETSIINSRRQELLRSLDQMPKDIGALHTTLEGQNVLLGKNGMLIMPKNGKFELVDLESPKSYGVFESSTSAWKAGLKKFTEQVSPTADVLPTTDEMIRLRAVQTLNFGDSPALAQTYKVANNLTESLQRGNIDEATKIYSAIKRNDSPSLFVVEPKVYKTFAYKSGDPIPVPKDLTTKTAQDFYTKVSLPLILRNVGDINAPLTKTLTKLQINKVTEELMMQEAKSIATRVSPGTEIVKETDDLFHVVSPTGEKISYSSLGEVLSRLQSDPAVFNPATYNKYLQNEFGATTTKLDDGRVLLNIKTGKGVSEKGQMNAYKDYNDLWSKNPDLRPGFSIEPTDFIIRPGTSEMTVKGAAIYGPADTLMKVPKRSLNSLSSIKSRTVLAITSDKSIVSKIDTQFHVDVPATGAVYKFNKLEDAMSFVRNGTSEWKGVTDAALSKGYSLTPDIGGRFVLTSKLDNKLPPKIFNSLDEVVADLKQYSVPDVNEHFAQFADIIQSANTSKAVQDILSHTSRNITDLSLDSAINLSKVKSFEAKQTGAIGTQLNNVVGSLRMQRDQFRSIDRSLGKEFLNPVYEDFNKAERFLDTKLTAVKQEVNRVWSYIPDKRAEELYAAFTAPAEEMDGLLKTMKATDRERAALDVTRHAFDKIFASLGFNAKLYRENYLPQIERSFDGKTLNDFKDLDPKKALQNVWGKSTLPTELNFFMGELRTIPQASTLLLEKNIKTLFDTYASIGLKKKYLESVYQEIDQLSSVEKALKSGRLTAEDIAKNKIFQTGEYDQIMDTWISTIKGADKSQASKAQTAAINGAREWVHNNVTNAIRKSRGMSETVYKPINDDFVDLGKKVVGINALGLSLGKAFRDVLSVFGLGGANLGPDFIRQSILNLEAQGLTEDVLKSLSARGQIATNITAFSISDTGKTILDKIGKVALQPQHSADVYQRVVVAHAADLRFQSAWKVAQSKPAQFATAANLQVLDPEEANQIIKHVQKGDYNSALATYQDMMLRNTSFTFMKSDMPQALQGEGTIRKMFGHFGVYPISYASAISKAMTNTLKTQGIPGVISFVTTMAITTAGVRVAYEKLMNLNPDSALPWNQMLFSGGPLFNIMNDTLNMTRQGVAGDQARRDLYNSLTRMGLGGIAQNVIKNTSEGIAENNPNKIWSGLLNMSYYSPHQ